MEQIQRGGPKQGVRTLESLESEEKGTRLRMTTEGVTST